MAKVVYWKTKLDCSTISNDISQVKATAVVVGEEPSLHGKSLVTHTLIRKVPNFNESRLQFERLHRSLDLWSVKSSHLGSTFKYVIHAVMKNGSDKEWAKNMKALYHRVFREAEILNTSKLALPLFGAGVGAADAGLAVRVLVASVLSYIPRRHISIIVVSKDGNRLDELETQFIFQLRYPEENKDLFENTSMTVGAFLPKPKAVHKLEGKKLVGHIGFATNEELGQVLERSAREAVQKGNAQNTQRIPRKGIGLCPHKFVVRRDGFKKRYNESFLSSSKEDDDLQKAIELSKREALASTVPTTSTTTYQAPGLGPDTSKKVDENILGYNKELQRVRDMAIKKGFTTGGPRCGRDLLTSLSEQVTHVMRAEMQPGHLRAVVARYLRNCQSNNDTSLEMFLIGTSLEEVLTTVEKGGYVESHIILSAVCNALHVEVLLLAASGEEMMFQPFGGKEFLPTLALGNISENRFISLQHVGGHISMDKPPTWSQSSKETELVTLMAESEEFQEVQQSFFSTIGWSSDHNMIQIQRVQSTTVWNHFTISRDQMRQRLPNMTCERLLWHGTSSESIRSICKEGFNRSFCGKNATCYGEGVYFSETSSYAARDRYSVPGVDGIKHMFRARVLTGQYTEGKWDMKVPPWFDVKVPIRYDSVVDDVDKPNCFVIFHDTKAYPEYLVKFT